MLREEAISRETVINRIANTCFWLSADNWEELIKCINSISSVTPKAEQKWIPCAERLPEEHEWIGTKEFGTTISDEVYVTFESPKGERFAKHLRFQNGRVSNAVQREIDAFHKGSVPVAWMPLPQPYKAESEEEK